MKTFSNYLALITFLIIANFSIASDINPDTNSTNFERTKSFTFIPVNNDNDRVKSDKKPYAEGKSNDINVNAPVTVENDLGYLKFDVNKFIDENESEITELPVSEFDYLRFDVNDFVEPGEENLGEMPINEFDCLRFDVNSFIKAALSNDANEIGELPMPE
jgi:hypothetical protein